MLIDCDYECGCRVRTGVDPADGIDTSRLYACRLGADCPNAALFIRTVETLASEGDAKVRHFRGSEGGPKDWKPLVKPVSDDPPDDPDAPLERINKTFDCGCRLIAEPPEEEGGAPTMIWLACEKSMECGTALEGLMILKAICEPGTEIME